MKPDENHHRFRPRSSLGFSLLELLTVIAIIILMTGLGARFLAPSQGSSVRQAAAMVGGIFQNARTAAVMKGVPTRILVYIDPDDPERYLRYVVPVYFDPSDNSWKMLDRGVYLPAHVYFDTARSTDLTNGQTIPNPQPVSWAQTGPAGKESAWLGYQFEPNGVLSSAEAQVVLAIGRNQTGAQVPDLDREKVAGFWMNRFGVQSYFDSNEEIIR